MRVTAAWSWLVLVAIGCGAGSGSVEPPRRAEGARSATVATPPAPEASTSPTLEAAPPIDPLKDRIDEKAALDRGAALAALKAAAPSRFSADHGSYFAAHPVSPIELQRVLATLTGPCLDQKDREASACAAIREGKTEGAKLVLPLVELLGELAPLEPGATPATRLLVALGARGFYQADMAVERILERRFAAHLGPCAPPTAEEITRASETLDDYVVVAVDGAVRAPTAKERADLAYLCASIGDAPADIGAGAIAPASKLAADDPAVVQRNRIRAGMQEAMLVGDITAYVPLADQYLRSLGFPGAVRANEEGDERWGGLGLSYVMRDYAKAAEILGKHEVAEQLYRDARPGGGMCGTSTDSRRDDQREGAIRAAEQRLGCRRALLDRLAGTTFDPYEHYGTKRLSEAGFDVARLYRGAFLSLGRDREQELRTRLQGSAFASTALPRLERRGPEAFGARVDAIAGLARTTGRGSIETLLAIAETEHEVLAPHALEVLGELLMDLGNEPCREGSGRMRRIRSRHRNIASLQDVCATVVDEKTVAGIVGRIAKLATSKRPAIREAVARALGDIASPSGKKTLSTLARDAFDVGGQICTSTGKGPSVCRPNRPVREAATSALEAIRDREKRIREERRGR